MHSFFPWLVSLRLTFFKVHPCCTAYQGVNAVNGADIFNPKYLGGGSWEGHGLRPVQGKCKQDLISINKPSIVCL
jgi:hypothetical protein